jgi:pimeloyl-ACP methyl ester carboxylesterase
MVLLAGILAVVLHGLPLLTGTGGGARGPDDGGIDAGIDGGTAHPGYTIVLPELAPRTVDGAATDVHTGVTGHAGYAIEVPADWNGDLVLWAHGFLGNGPELRVEPPGFGLRQRLVAQGYAWAASSYDRNGYDVASGVRSTRALADEFARVVGEPERTYLIGVSMGGHIAARSLEEHAGRYDGALTFCGALGDHALFDYFLDVHVVAGALAGVPAYPPAPDYTSTTLPRMYRGLGMAPEDPAVTTSAARQLRAATVLLSGGARPGVHASFGYWKDFLLTLPAPETAPTPVEGVAADPALVAGNLNTDYVPDAPVDLDAAVQRVAVADPATRRSTELTPVAQVRGLPSAPVLTLHGLGDLFVPFSMEQIYAAEVAAAGREDLLVQRAIRTTGHCEFSAAEAGDAWDDLVAWVEDGATPAGDDVRDLDLVAGPEYGCRFSDREAYADAGTVSQTDTRRLFEPCAGG